MCSFTKHLVDADVCDPGLVLDFWEHCSYPEGGDSLAAFDRFGIEPLSLCVTGSGQISEELNSLGESALCNRIRNLVAKNRAVSSNCDASNVK